MRKLIFIIPLLFSTLAYASRVTVPVIWNNGDTVTDAKLNSINNAFANILNGNIDNTNTAPGYGLIHSVSSLPTAGIQGSVDFLTTDNSLNIDNGASWLKAVFPSGTPQTGSIAYYNSGWQLLNPGAQYFSLVSNGVSSLPSYQQIDLSNGVTGQLPLATGVSGNLSVNNLNGGTAATSKTFWRGDGTWANPAMIFVSTASFSGASSTASVTVDPTVVNEVVVQITGNVGGGGNLLMNFNADASAGHYAWVNEGFDTNASAIAAHNNSDSKIQLFNNLLADGGSNSDTNITFYLYPQIASNYSDVKGDGWGKDGGSNGKYVDIYAHYLSSSAITSLNLSTSDSSNISGTITVYKLATL